MGAEALVISLFGTVEGLLLGVVIGWRWSMAALAGIQAPAAPSRRAAWLDNLRAVATA